MKEALELSRKETSLRSNGKSFETAISVLPVVNSEREPKSRASLHDYLRAILKRLWMIIGVTFLCTLLFAIYMARQQDVYEAQARVQVDLENNPAGDISRGAAGSSTVNDPTYFSTQLQILTGSGLLRRVAKTLDLEHNQGFLRPQSQKLSTWQNLLRLVGLGGKESDGGRESAKETSPLVPRTVAPPTSNDDLEEAKRLAPYVSALQKNLIVEPVKDTRLAIRETRLIDIRFTHPDPQIAAKVVNAIANALVLSNLEKRTETNAYAGDFLQKRIAELQAQIRSDEERLMNYAKNNQILSLDAAQNTVVDRLSSLNKQLLEAENIRKAAEAAYRAANGPGAAQALIEGKSSQTIVARTTLAALKQRRAQLLAETTEEWPEVKEIDKQIAELEKQISEENRRQTTVVLSTLQTKYREALANEEALRDAFNKQRAETVTQNEASVNYKIIQQEIDTSKSLLDGLLQRSKENDVILAAIPNNIHVADYALVPSKPVGPKRLMGVMMAFISSLFLSVGLALLLGQLDDSIKSEDDVDKILKLPVIATIPPAGRLKGRLPRATDALQLRHGSWKGYPALLVNTDIRAPLAEAYRKLRTFLLRSTSGERLRTVLVTSSLPTEGKTTTAINTALVLAKTGVNVLIIDADMRHPSHHTIFDLDGEHGLSTLLMDRSSVGQAKDIIKRHEQSGLNVLTAGPEVSSPSELLGSEEMAALISTLAATFDHIIIDAPPITFFTDSVLLASIVDGVLLVVNGGKSSAKIVKHAKKELQSVGSNILGVVLNNVKSGQQDYYSYYKVS